MRNKWPVDKWPVNDLESDVDQHLVKQVNKRRGISFKLAPTRSGVPDRLVVLPPGRMFLVELKTDTGKLSAIQAAFHRTLWAKGVRVHVLHGKGQVDAWLHALDAYQDKS